MALSLLKTPSKTMRHLKGLHAHGQIPPFFHVGNHGGKAVLHEGHGRYNGTHCSLVAHVGDTPRGDAATVAHAADVGLGVVFHRGCPAFNPTADGLQPVQTTIIAQCYYGGSVPPCRRFEYEERFVVLNIGQPLPLRGVTTYVQWVVVSESSRFFHFFVQK